MIGTLNLLNAINQRAGSIARILVASSANIYGNTTSLPITEDTPPNPVNHYGVSKLAMESSAALYEDLPVTRVRPFNYTGVGQSISFLIPKIVNAFQKRDKQIQLGNLDVSRDFSDVRDVASAYIKLLKSNDIGPVYNICTGFATSLESVISTLNRLAGYEIEVSTNPAFVRPDEIKILYGSPQRLESTIGNYRQFTLQDTLAWMMQNGESG